MSRLNKTGIFVVAFFGALMSYKSCMLSLRIVLNIKYPHANAH